VSFFFLSFFFSFGTTLESLSSLPFSKNTFFKVFLFCFALLNTTPLHKSIRRNNTHTKKRQKKKIFPLYLGFYKKWISFWRAFLILFFFLYHQRAVWCRPFSLWTFFVPLRQNSKEEGVENNISHLGIQIVRESALNNIIYRNDSQNAVVSSQIRSRNTSHVFARTHGTSRFGLVSVACGRKERGRVRVN